MEAVRSLRSDLTYCKRLLGAGWNGIAAARKQADRPLFSPPLQSVVWTPTAVGATVGALTRRLIGKDKSASGVALGGLLGSVLGLSAVLVWASREFTGPAARKSLRCINAARDAHWLESHPIDYA